MLFPLTFRLLLLFNKLILALLLLALLVGWSEFPSYWEVNGLRLVDLLDEVMEVSNRFFFWLFAIELLLVLIVLAVRAEKCESPI
jgi:hypothetical protein